MKHRVIFAAAVVLSCAAPAFASTTIDFSGQTSGYQSNPLTLGSTSFSTTGSGLYVSDFGNGTGNSLCPTQSGVYCDATLNVSFASAVDGLSFLYAGVDDAASSINVLLTYFGGGSGSFSFTPIGDNGVVDLSAQNNIVGASITTNDSAGLTYDNFTFTAAAGVPEPATWAMMLLGFGAVGWTTRRKRRPAALLQLA